MFNAVREAFGFRKPADTDMQQIHPADPAQPTVAEMDKTAAAFKRQRDLWFRAAMDGDKLRHEAIVTRNQAHKKLREIAAQETDGANATVKRMARMAREALPEYADGVADRGVGAFYMPNLDEALSGIGSDPR
jgi:hypothetical protein